MNAAAFSLDVEVDSSPTQVSRRRAHIREISRVRHLAIALTIALAFTSGLGAALAVQLAQTAGGIPHARTPRIVVTRAASLEITSGASEKHVAQPADDKPLRKKSARTRRGAAPATPSATPAAESSSEVLLPGELLDRGIVNPAPPTE